MSKVSVLDDLDRMKQVDRSGMLSFCVDSAKHYVKAGEIAESLSLDYPEPQSIITAGMGGSAIGGELLKDWARDKVPIPVEVVRDYSLPAYADRKTLVFVVSYSGETEESLSVLLEAVKRKCMVVCVSSGGTLQEFAEKLSIPHLLIPSGMAPRASLPYLFLPLPVFLEKLGLASGVASDIRETVKVVRLVSDANLPENPSSSNFNKMLALNVHGTVPVVYGFGVFRAVAQRFKTQFNENSKVPAKWEFFPELDHNEIVGWEAANEFAKCFSVIFIRDKSEEEAMRIRIEATRELMTNRSVRSFEVRSAGKSMLARMSSIICIGDFTSVYLAVLRGVDPTPVKTIDLLKEKIRRSGSKDRIVHELRKIAAK